MFLWKLALLVLQSINWNLENLLLYSMKSHHYVQVSLFEIKVYFEENTKYNTKVYPVITYKKDCILYAQSFNFGKPAFWGAGTCSLDM